MVFRWSAASLPRPVVVDSSIEASCMVLFFRFWACVILLPQQTFYFLHSYLDLWLYGHGGCFIYIAG